MIKQNYKNENGISLISLVIAVIVILILTGIIIYNMKDSLELGNLKNMQNDIENLRDKISSYYAQNGKIPAKLKYTNIEHLREEGVISDVTDTGDFLVIELSAIDNLTLNYGQDFEEVKNLETLTDEEAKEYTDLYIINETSHNIFYVEGINIEGENFYTDINAIDTKAVDLRYVDNIKIPEGYTYVEGNIDTGIVVKDSESNQYKWIILNEKIYDIPEGISVEQMHKEDFIKSVNAYNGYYKNETTNDVLYFSIEKWSPIYDKEGIYKDKNGDVAYIPKNFRVSQIPGEDTIEEGLVVKDSNNNEWVWIEVPRTIFDTAISNEDYTNIEKDIQDYVSNYRDSNCSDIWYSQDQHGFVDSDTYNAEKNKILKSIYDNGGFYVGRYEVGTDTVRGEGAETTEAFIQKDKYPYNFLTGMQAQQVANGLVDGEKTSGLMLGIQWDLMLKWIEVKMEQTQYELGEESPEWGNYNNSKFLVVRGKYTSTPETINSWVDVGTTYEKVDTSSILFTSGATNKNSILNIYDLAGNLSELTLEYSNDTTNPCVARGGSYSDTEAASVISRTNVLTGSGSVGFRAVLY